MPYCLSVRVGVYLTSFLRVEFYSICTLMSINTAILLSRMAQPILNVWKCIHTLSHDGYYQSFKIFGQFNLMEIKCLHWILLSMLLESKIIHGYSYMFIDICSPFVNHQFIFFAQFSISYFSLSNGCMEVLYAFWISYIFLFHMWQLFLPNFCLVVYIVFCHTYILIFM